MANCIKCGKYTKYENGLCPSCYHKNKKSNEEEIEQKPFLVQLTEFIDVVGKHGIGVTMVIAHHRQGLRGHKGFGRL